MILSSPPRFGICRFPTQSVLRRGSTSMQKSATQRSPSASALWRLAPSRRRRSRAGIVGANVGKNRDTTDGAADYIAGIEVVGALADYLVINISSPNTPGLRALQARAQIEELLARVQEFRC